MIVTTGFAAGGAGWSVEGTSPARAAPDNARESTTAITNRFMLSSPFDLNDARLLVTKTAYADSKVLARRARWGLTSSARQHRFLSLREGADS